MAGYNEMAGLPFQLTMGRCSFATLGDVVFTFWIYSLGALAAHTLRWGLRARWNVYAATALLGAIHAFLIERVAIESGRWSYAHSMPMVPLLNVGLWPLLQLTLLTPFGVWLSSHFSAINRKMPNDANPVVL